MKTRNYLNIVVTLTLLLGVPSALTAGALDAALAPQSTETATAKVVQLLQQSRYPSRKTGNNTWVIERPGLNKGKGWILAATGPDFLVVGIIVAEKKNMRPSADFYFKLLKLDHSLDYVKVGLDDDDDLFVRTEGRVRLLDLQEFKTMITNVDSGADKVKAEIQTFLITP